MTYALLMAREGKYIWLISPSIIIFQVYLERPHLFLELCSCQDELAMQVYDTDASDLPHLHHETHPEYCSSPGTSGFCVGMSYIEITYVVKKSSISCYVVS